MDRGVNAFGGIRESSIASPWWLMWIAVHKPLVAHGVIYKALMACVDRRLQAFGGRWSHLQAFVGIRGSSFTNLRWQMESFTSLWWHTWIVVYKAFGGVRGSSCRSLWWHTLIVDCKPLVANVDRLSQAFGGRWSRFQAFGGIRGLSCISFWWHIGGCWWRTWIVV